MSSRTIYDRSNQFAGDGVSDGQTLGASRVVSGLGTPAVITLNNPGSATCSMQRRRSDTEDEWTFIGVTVTDSKVHRMHLQANMDYRWLILTSGTQPAILAMREAIPTSFREHPELLELIPYSDGFPSPDGGLTSFLTGVSQNEIILKWSLTRAQSGYWTQQNNLCLGSNGLVYLLNPDKGGGIEGNPEIDPTSTQGTSQASWIAIGSIGTNVTTDFIAGAAGDVGSIPNDLPSNSENGSKQTHIRFYIGAIVVFKRDSESWAEQGRIALASSSGGSGLTTTEVTSIVDNRIDSKNYGVYLGLIDAVDGHPAGKNNDWFVAQETGDYDGVERKAWKAYRCNATSANESTPAAWVAYPSQDLPTHGEGPLSERANAPAWITNWRDTESTTGKKYWREPGAAWHLLVSKGADGASYGDSGTSTTYDYTLLDWADGVKKLAINNSRPYEITKSTIVSDVAGGTLSIRIDGTNIGGSSTALATTETEQDHTTLNVMSAGSYLEFETSGIATTANINVALEVTFL